MPTFCRLTSSGWSGSRLTTTPLSMKQPPSFRFNRKTGKSSKSVMSWGLSITLSCHGAASLCSTVPGWAAGVKAPAFLADLDGLESNRINQLAVLPTLQTTRDPNIFAFGDCAACPWSGGKGNVPPRAQVAHQQASHLVRTLTDRLRGAAP